MIGNPRLKGVEHLRTTNKQSKNETYKDQGHLSKRSKRL